MRVKSTDGVHVTRVGWFLVALLAFAGCRHGVGHHRPAWEKPPPPVQAAAVVAPGSLHRANLKNGLTVLVLEDHRLPRVALDLTVRRGAGSVNPDHAGLAAFTAELMNRGAGESNALELAQRVDDLGAGLAVVAGWDAMDVGVSGLSSDLSSLFEILREVVLLPRFEDGEAQKARSEQLAGLAATRDDPSSLARQSAMRVLYPGHRYGAPLEGTPETVQGLKAQDAEALHARYFVPGNAILAVVGDIEAQDIIDRARTAFGQWPKGEVPAETPAPPAATPSQRRIVIADAPDLVQSRIIIGHEGIARTDDRRVPAGLVNATLGGSGFSSRMMKNL
ncbi:MAG: pitrilysin family protein, partial [Myxococcota bacterium]|nr:pitrilysin family protein [Myxococcota bacterium]